MQILFFLYPINTSNSKLLVNFPHFCPFIDILCVFLAVHVKLGLGLHCLFFFSRIETIFNVYFALKALNQLIVFFSSLSCSSRRQIFRKCIILVLFEMSLLHKILVLFREVELNFRTAPFKLNILLGLLSLIHLAHPL